MGPTTRWVPWAANRLSLSTSKCSAIVAPPANIVGGRSVPLGRPVVPEVSIRLGRGATESGGSSSGPAASHWSQVVTSSGSPCPQPTTDSTPACRAASTPRGAVSGPTKRIRESDSSKM